MYHSTINLAHYTGPSYVAGIGYIVEIVAKALPTLREFTVGRLDRKVSSHASPNVLCVPNPAQLLSLLFKVLSYLEPPSFMLVLSHVGPKYLNK